MLTALLIGLDPYCINTVPGCSRRLVQLRVFSMGFLMKQLARSVVSRRITVGRTAVATAAS